MPASVLRRHALESSIAYINIQFQCLNGSGTSLIASQICKLSAVKYRLFLLRPHLNPSLPSHGVWPRWTTDLQSCDNKHTLKPQHVNMHMLTRTHLGYELTIIHSYTHMANKLSKLCLLFLDYG